MTLTLTVLRCPPNVAPEVRQVTGGEFSIGRGPENDWVLPDPAKHLSKRHCVIAFRQGEWQIAGTSTNGTFINGDTSPLETRAPHSLQDGDRIVLGVYEIEAGLAAAQERPWGQSPATSAPSPFDKAFDDDIFRPAPPPAEYSAGLDRDEDRPSPRLPANFNPIEPEDDDYSRTEGDRSPAISESISLPQTRSVLPADWDVDVPAVQPPPQTPALPVPPSAPPTRAPSGANTSSDDLLAAFLRGAGMEPLDIADPVRTMEQLGAAFRATVAGIRQALIARSEVKRTFRIDETLIRRRGNNLLKFSRDDDAALAGLLGADRRGEMGPAESITDALTNIRLHELATTTAMQSAARALVESLAPDRITDVKEPAGAMALLGNRKARAWDAYEAAHAAILRSLSDNFDSVFGKRFAVAYERAMEEFAAREKHRRDDER